MIISYIIEVASVLQNFVFEIYGSTMLLSIFMTVSSFDWILLSQNVPPDTTSLSLIKYNKYVSESISSVVGLSNLEEWSTKLSFKWVDNCNA